MNKLQIIINTIAATIAVESIGLALWTHEPGYLMGIFLSFAVFIFTMIELG